MLSNRRRRPLRSDDPVLTLGVAVALVTAGFAHTDYTVRPRDTLDAIARRHGTTVSVLADENAISDPNRIRAGTTLAIPDPRGTPGGTPDSDTSGAGSARHHVVRSGESLSTIGRRYGVSVAELADWNGLGDANRVPAGARISVAGPSAQNVATGGGGTHRVAAGETLSHVALRFGASASEIARANQIADPHRVVAGTTLTIPGGWHCPVRGPARFVNDFGISKPSGVFHDGVDLFAPRGTPVVAPVAGRVEHVTGERAGLQFRLRGVDGHVYIGTHLDDFGAAGDVQAGEVLGTVGTSGNARGTAPHLHFEIHVDGEHLTNPHPSLRAACG